MKNKFNKINKLVSGIKNNTEWVDSDSAKHTSELIKLIPYLGSFLNSVTLQRLRDENLETRLNQFESGLRDSVTFQEFDQVQTAVEENRFLILYLLSNYRKQIFGHDPKALETVTSFLAVPSQQKEVYRPHPKFHFVVISGASATGKDVQLDMLLGKSLNSRLDVLNKYTTRQPRQSESDYNIIKKPAQFQKLKEDGKVLFPYEKRTNHYGFDKSQFIMESQSDTILMCIFTEFMILPMAKQFLLDQGISTTFILFETPLNELIRRSHHRNFAPNEIKKRTQSIMRDLSFISNNSSMIDKLYDHKLDTSDSSSVDDINRELVKIVRAI